MLNIGWVDFSDSDRDRLLSALEQPAEQEARDELGIGTIRAAFADRFFPGTTTNHTWAKYLFIIPYICLDLERNPDFSPRTEKEFIAKLEELELKRDLIDALIKSSGAKGGVFGSSGKDIRKKPSEIYWNALCAYGFFTKKNFFTNKRLTLKQYAAEVCARKKKAADLKKSGGKRQRRNKDEEDAPGYSAPSFSDEPFWHEGIPYRSDWQQKGLTIHLKPKEAAFLCDQILSMKKTHEKETPEKETPDSLLALILSEERRGRDFLGFESFDDIYTWKDIMPRDMLRDYKLARDFSSFVFGAQVRYNVLFSGGENTDANKFWAEYKPPQIDLGAVQAYLHSRGLSPSDDMDKTMKFLRSFKQSFNNTDKLDKLIIQREIDLKRERAKLTNKERYDGKNVNLKRLDYRFSNVKNWLVHDIFEGLYKNA